jgi:hypothetical protein
MNIKKIIREEVNDLEWIRNAAINFEDVNLRVGDKFRVPTLNPDGSTFSIVTIIDIGLRGNEPITYRRESGMGQLQQRNLVDSPFYYNRGFKLNESDDFDWIRDVKPEVYLNQKLWNTRRHILYVVSDIRYGTEEWMTDSVHLTCKWASESRLITLKRVQDLIEEGIFQDVTNLSSKDYIRLIR